MNTGEASASFKAGNKARETGEKPVPFHPRRSDLRDQRPIYNVTCSAPISFSLCFPISPCLLFFMFFLKPLSSIVEKLLYTYIYK